MSIISNTLRAIRFTGLRVVYLSALYSLRRAMGRPAPEPQPSDCVLIPGGLLRGEPDASGLTLHYAHAQLRVDFLDPGIVRLDWSPGVSLPPYAIARTQWPDPHLHIRETYSGWRLTSTELDLHLTRDGAVPPEGFLHVNYLDLNTNAVAQAGRLFAAAMVVCLVRATPAQLRRLRRAMASAVPRSPRAWLMTARSFSIVRPRQ